MWYYFSNAVQVVPAFEAFDEVIMQAIEEKAFEQYFHVVLCFRAAQGVLHFRGYAFMWKLFIIVNKMSDSRRSTARIAVAEYCQREYLEY